MSSEKHYHLQQRHYGQYLKIIAGESISGRWKSQQNVVRQDYLSVAPKQNQSYLRSQNLT